VLHERGSTAKGSKAGSKRQQQPSHCQLKPLPPEAPPTIKILPIKLKFGDRFTTILGERMVVGRPYTSAGGKTDNVRVESVKQSGRFNCAHGAR
jgi:hypothetical protein